MAAVPGVSQTAATRPAKTAIKKDFILKMLVKTGRRLRRRVNDASACHEISPTYLDER
jgi:hypothetical protein